MSRAVHNTKGVHLVGSVPLSDAASTFNIVSASLGERLRRIPDGETGNRGNFAAWQIHVFQKSTFVLNEFFYERSVETPNTTIDILPTSYDDKALESYKEFCNARDQGHIPDGVRFQVCLPTPLNIIAGCVAKEYQSLCETMYKARLLDSLRRIQDKIPARDLAIQWDAPMEFAMLEGLGGMFTPWFSPLREGLIERFVELAEAVDENVDMGYHLCYGDMNHQHFIEPKDMGLMVEITNLLKDAVDRRIDWVHMPVPKDRMDDAYFKPLETIELGTMELYLGVVHPNDEEGTRRRIETARSFVQDFGISTECGMGRTPAEHLESILEISAAVST